MFTDAPRREAHDLAVCVSLAQRQAHDELAALADAVAARLNRAAVELDELARERPSDAHAGARFDVVGMCLREQLEDPRPLTGGDADAGIVNTHDTFLPFCAHRQRDLPAGRRVTRRVA